MPGSALQFSLNSLPNSLYDWSMSELEPHPPWPGLPTIHDETALPAPPDTLSEAERQALRQTAEAVVLDLTHPAPLPASHDLFVAEPLHPVVVELESLG